MKPKSTPMLLLTQKSRSWAVLAGVVWLSVALGMGACTPHDRPDLPDNGVDKGRSVDGIAQGRSDDGVPQITDKKRETEGGQKDTVEEKLPKEGGSAEDQKLFREVMDRLLQTKEVRDNWPAAFGWRPQSFILPDSAKELNAFAMAYAKDPDSGKFLVRAVITEGYMNKIVDGSDEILAAIMGHELAHLTKGHLANKIKADLLSLNLSRDQEIEADLEGVRIAVAAGYSYRSGVRSAFREWKALGDYSNFEGIRATHPSWTERLSLLDHNQAHIWKAMAAFQNGYFFLHAEQYPAAENCFQQVVDDFPDCAEAYANLGYARLMQYCDSMDEADVRNLKIGQFVAGCFYAQAKDLAPVIRGDRKKWQQAVNTLEIALRRHTNLSLAHANLGLAYLVHPDGKKTAEALKHFADAYKEKGKGLDGLSSAALLVNYGVAEQAAGNNAAASEKFKLARKALPTAKPSPVSSQVALALLYNEATLAASGDRDNQADAFMDFEDYLAMSSPDSAWWKLAGEQYDQLGRALGKKVAPSQELSKRFGNKFLRLVTSVELAPGKLVTLSDSTAKVLTLLGRENMAGIPVYHRSTIKRYNGVHPGMDVLGRDTILAVFLTSSDAPPVHVQPQGIGGAKVELRVGMAVDEFREALKNQPEQEGFMVVDPDLRYVFLPYLGLAYRVQRDRVAEIVLAQVARKAGD